MRLFSINHPITFTFRNVLLALTLGVVATVAAGEAEVVPRSSASMSPWSFSGGLELRGGYDSNLFLQDIGDLAHKGSMFTTVSPFAGAAFDGGASFSASLDYRLDASWYHSQSTEDNYRHALKFAASGVAPAEVEYSLTAGLIYVDGDNETLTFTEPGGAPAFGGIDILKRRDGTFFFGGLTLSRTFDKTLVRPLFSWKVDNFRTIQRAIPGYLNYTDRSDVSIGLDVGHEVTAGLKAFVGYRFGHQSQDQCLKNPTQYDNDYQRVLLGLEGSPAKWVKLSLVGGPDFREYGSNTALGFDTDQVLLYFDAAIHFMPTDADTITLKAKKFQQPGFCGASIYEDAAYGITWIHRFGHGLALNLGGLAHQAAFQSPANRDDWIYTLSGTMLWAWTDAASIEVGYLYDWSDSMVPNTPSREYTRHLVHAGISVKF